MRMRFVSHIHRLWGRYWLVPAVPPLALAVYVLLGEARIEHYVLLTGATLLAVASRFSRDLLLAVIPGIGIFLGYEIVRVLRPVFVAPDRIWACEFQRLDSALFGFGSGLAPADLFARHHAVLADLAMAVPYTVFWVLVMAYCGVLFLVKPGLLRRYLWVLAVAHFLAFSIWMIVPAAPPWYVRTFGCAIDTAVAPSAAALLRLDAMFGITYFEAFYSRAPTVFGAFPSLHVSFPAVALVTGWQVFGMTGRIVTLLMTLWMLAASVYLDHHWLIDGLTTIALVLLIHAVLRRFWTAYNGLDQPGHWRELARWQ